MKRYILFIVPVVLALLLSSVTAMIIMMMTGQQPAFAQGGPSACPDSGRMELARAATGVMTDHAMPQPFIV